MDELNHADLDPEEIAGIALATLGVMVEEYCQEGYCDPTMYRAVALAEILARKLGVEELETRLSVVKLFAGETVNEMIEKHGMDIKKGEW